MKHKEEIFRLRSEGKSYREIQSILGCSKGTIAYHLGENQRKKSSERLSGSKKKIKQYIRQHKESSGCIDCKEKYPYYMLDLDHINDKKFNISKFSDFTYNLEIIKKEIEKCEVVCANCHRIRTWNRLL
jgi:transposase